jgi:hypothetical protein
MQDYFMETYLQTFGVSADGIPVMNLFLSFGEYLNSLADKFVTHLMHYTMLKQLTLLVSLQHKWVLTALLEQELFHYSNKEQKIDTRFMHYFQNV